MSISYQYVIETKDVGLEVEGAERSIQFVARFSARDRRISSHGVHGVYVFFFCFVSLS